MEPPSNLAIPGGGGGVGVLKKDKGRLVWAGLAALGPPGLGSLKLVKTACGDAWPKSEIPPLLPDTPGS